MVQSGLPLLENLDKLGNVKKKSEKTKESRGTDSENL